MPEFIQVLDNSAEWIILVIIIVGITQNLIALVQLIVASLFIRKSDLYDRDESLWQRRAPSAPPIALISPAFNEEKTIIQSIKSLMALHYPNFEIIVVNDGSKDNTLELLIKHFELEPCTRAYEEIAKHQLIKQLYQSRKNNKLFVVDKINGGKADSLNAGINFSRSTLFCAVDADSMLEKASLLYAIQPFYDNPDEVIAVGGTIRVANGCTVKGGKILNVGLPKKILPTLQTIEYIRAFLIARIAMSHMGILTLISGAFGIFRRKAALDAGAYATDTVGEDYELILRMHRYHIENNIPYEIRFVAEPVCWTEVPESLNVLANQRRRWQRGSLETFFRHRHMLLNPRYGKIGLIGMPFSLIIDVLGPLAEVLGYLLVPLFWFSGILNTEYALAFIALTFIWGIFISTGSLVLEELSLHRLPKARNLIKLLGIILIENFGYRQLNNIWRLQGWIEFLQKKKSWGKMTRTGFNQEH
jgi:cellulose synthase/poly-beta-1,6-N-acetylglucosamine synthase-like glycosyltransferase